MNPSPKYAQSPITEAILDVKVTIASNDVLSKLEEVSLTVKENYPYMGEIRAVEIENQIKGRESVEANLQQNLLGYNCRSKDQQQTFQIRLNGFSFSRFQPYDSWENYQTEARKLWDIYQSIIQPETIDQIKLRYVNRLNIPLPINDLKEYFLTIPEVSPSLPQELSSYFMQLQIPQTDLEGIVILNQATISSPNPNVISILLDIDLVKEINLIDNQSFQLWDSLDRMHYRIYEIFEACITDKTRRLIN